MIDPNVQGALNGQPEQQPAQPPQQQQGGAQAQEVLLGWIRGAYGVAGLGPASVRDVLTRAQKNYSDMINKTMSKQFPEAQRDRYEWEQNTSVALDINRRRLDEYGAAFLGDTALEEKMARVADVASRWGDQTVAQLAGSPEHFTTFAQYYDQLEKQQQQFETSTQSLDTYIKTLEQKFGLHNKSGQLPPIDPYIGGDE